MTEIVELNAEDIKTIRYTDIETNQSIEMEKIDDDRFVRRFKMDDACIVCGLRLKEDHFTDPKYKEYHSEEYTEEDSFEVFSELEACLNDTSLDYVSVYINDELVKEGELI